MSAHALQVPHLSMAKVMAVALYPPFFPNPLRISSWRPAFSSDPALFPLPFLRAGSCQTTSVPVYIAESRPSLCIIISQPGRLREVKRLAEVHTARDGRWSLHWSDSLSSVLSIVSADSID